MLFEIKHHFKDYVINIIIFIISFIITFFNTQIGFIFLFSNILVILIDLTLCFKILIFNDKLTLCYLFKKNVIYNLQEIKTITIKKYGGKAPITICKITEKSKDNKHFISNLLNMKDFYCYMKKANVKIIYYYNNKPQNINVK